MSTPRNTKSAAETPAVQPTNQVSLWSMITGIASLTVGWFIPLPFGIAAVVLGHIGLVQVKRTGQEGRTYAITGLILGYLAVFISTVVIGFLVLWGLATFAHLFDGYGSYGGFGGGMMNP